MIVAGSASPLLLSSAGGYNLTKSLRFRSSASANLTRTVTGVNTTQLTFSFWLKYSVNPSDNVIYATSNNSSNYLYIGFNSSYALDVQIGATANRRVTTQVFRDPSAWYHIVVTFDTTQATASDRIKVYVNGSQVTAFSTNTTGMSQNSNLPSISSTLTNYIGNYNGSAGFYYDGYMAELNAVYGQALTPSSFGQTSPTTGVWQPKRYTGTYGTNGFYLPFTNTSSTATLGNDFSGNNNTWTVNNISLTSGATYDSMNDVPTNTDTNTANYCTWNPLDRSTNNGQLTIVDGNLGDSAAAGVGGASVAATHAISSGKWYYEWRLATNSSLSRYPAIGWIAKGVIDGNYLLISQNTGGAVGYEASGQVYANNVLITTLTAYNTAGDIIGVAYDADTGKIWFAKNGTWMASGDPANGTNPVHTLTGLTRPAISQYNGSGGAVNFGQRPFAYTPPTGFVRLNTFNLPTPTIGATASTQAGKNFNVVTYTGTGSSLSVTGVGFQPDLTWIKGRSGATDHGLYDAIRGVQKQLESNTTTAETTETTGLTAFGSDGFTVGALAQLNNNTATYVGWNWKANGSGSSNTQGSITSTVSANTTSGFSIVTYTGNGTTGATVGHGLGVAPAMVIVKKRSSTGNWITYHVSTGVNQYLYLNSTAAAATASPTWAVSSTTITFQQAFSDYNDNGVTYVAYCFAQIAGYSAFGSYTGNGSSDGPFVFTGFRPRYVLIKRTDAANDWVIIDTARDPINLATKALFPNSSSAETSNGFYDDDILSNGFKIRATNSVVNANGGTYIYMAFCESPFKYANAR